MLELLENMHGHLNTSWKQRDVFKCLNFFWGGVTLVNKIV